MLRGRKLVLLCALVCMLTSCGEKSEELLGSNQPTINVSPIIQGTEMPSIEPTPIIELNAGTEVNQPVVSVDSTPTYSPDVLNEEASMVLLDDEIHPILTEFIATLKLGDAEVLYTFTSQFGTEDMLYWRFFDSSSTHYYSPFIAYGEIDFGPNFNELYVQSYEMPKFSDSKLYILRSSLNEVEFYFDVDAEGKFDFYYLRYLPPAAYLADQYLSLLRDKDLTKLERFLLEDDLVYGEDNAKILLENYYRYFDFNETLTIEYAGANYNSEFKFNIVDEGGKTHQFFITFGDGIWGFTDTMSPRDYPQ